MNSLRLKNTLKDVLIIGDHSENHITRNIQWFSPIFNKKSNPNEISIRIPSNQDYY